MKIDLLKEAVQEAKRFIKRADAALLATKIGQANRESIDPSRLENNPAENGAVRRSSMDLTRSLAALRKGNL